MAAEFPALGVLDTQDGLVECVVARALGSSSLRQSDGEVGLVLVEQKSSSMNDCLG